MGHKHTKDEILAEALQLGFDEGLGALSFGRVAKRMGISDRIVVYYFPSKDDLIGEVLVSMGLQLQATLAAAFPSPSGDYLALARKAWPILASAKSDPVFALFFEAAGLAATKVEPYSVLVPQLIEAWIAWVSSLVDGSPTRRRTEAEAAVALLDGLLLIRHVSGAQTANRAARRLGVR